MANFRASQTSAIATRGLILAVVICRLASSTASKQEAQAQAKAPTSASAQSDWNNSSAAADEQPTACDSLFIGDEKLAKYCLCKDQQPQHSDPNLDLDPTPNLMDPSGQLRASRHIGELSCRPNDLSSISELLSSALAAKHQLTFRIDYLNINTNITAPTSGRPNAPTSAAVGPLVQPARLQIDHISVHLQMGDESPRGDTGKASQRDQAESRPTTLEDQMIDFCGLINETHLQFLSISMAAARGDKEAGQVETTANQWAEDNNFVQEIRLSRLLAKLGSLNRLELNFDLKSHRLLMEREMFRHQHHLKWLNLASSRGLRLLGQEVAKKRSPFSWASQLEYLSLESCDLEQFPLFSLFPVQFKLASPQQQQQQQSQQQQQQPTNVSSNQVAIRSVFGLPNLTTLNLASNKIRSLDEQVFSSADNSSVATICQDAQTHQGVPFILPSLTQLDLSKNQLEALTVRAAQYILCTMPNLSQLFLRRNNIKHLNLNSLLLFPTHLARLGTDQLGQETGLKQAPGRPRQSKLEYLDLSSNELVQISAIISQINQQTDPAGGTRIKSINLSQNKLTNLITMFDSALIDRLIFDESLNYHTPAMIDGGHHLFRLDQLDRNFRLTSAQLSICDFLSPKLLRGPKLAKFERPPIEDSESLVNEVIINENELTKISGDDFRGHQCADMQILRLSSNRIKSISDRAFESLMSLEQLDLSSNYLAQLESSLFIKNTKLRILSLARNKITSLDKRLLNNVTELEEIYLNDNELYEVPLELFARTSRLRVVDLASNKLTYLAESMFCNLDELQVLNLEANQLANANYLSLFRQIDNGIVKSMTALILHPRKSSGIANKEQQRQMISSNRMNHIESSKKVKSRRNRAITNDANNILNFAGNQIETLSFETSSDQSGSCDNQTFLLGLQTVWLNNNKLRDLPGGAFKCFESVQRLYLHSNQLRTLDESIFKALTRLETVDLSNNQLTGFNLFALPFKHVDLSSNKLITLGLLPTRDGSQIEYLDISSNSELVVDSAKLLEFISKSSSLRTLKLVDIKQIATSNSSDDVERKPQMSTAANLNRLDLSGSRMDSGTISAWSHRVANDQSPLSQMLIGRIGANQIRAMQALIVGGLHRNLMDLDASENGLDTELVRLILKPSLMGVGGEHMVFSLKHLNLSWNLIDSWPISELIGPRLVELTSLDLSQNKIRHLINRNNSLIGYSLPGLEQLNLSSNSMVSLIVQPLMQDLQKQSLARLMPALKDLDLSHNRLSWIPAQFFENLSRLVRLRLDHNQLEIFPSSLLLAGSARRAPVLFNLDHNRNMRSPLIGSDASGQEESSNYALNIDTLAVDVTRLILFADSSNQISRCQRVERFVRESEVGYLSQTIRGRAQFLHLDQHANQAIPEQVLDEDHHDHDDDDDDDQQCRRLISLTRSISFNSIGANVSDDLSSLWTRANIDNQQPNQLLDLRLRRNDLRTIEAGKFGAAIRLDLSDNRLEKVASLSECANLLTLDLSRNQIRELSFVWTSSCAKLTYLDLSHNEISSLAGHQNERRVSSLLVLNLSHNSLTALDGLPPYLLGSLRLIDLRFNQLKSPQIGPPLLQRPLPSILIHSNQLEEAQMEAQRPLLRLDEASVQLEWNENRTTTRARYALGVTSFGQELELSADQSIRFCTLEPNSLTRICLKRLASIDDDDDDDDDHYHPDKCLLLKVPRNISSCLTDLRQVAQGKSDSMLSAQSYNKSSDIYQPSKVLISSKAKSQLNTEDDLVLNLIDSMKKSWLNLRELDVNEYLADSLRSGSVWVELGQRYQMNSLTVIKMAIVVGSMCIVGLLVAIFILLTYFSHSKVSPDHSDTGSASELTTVTSPDSTSFSLSSNAINNRSVLTNCSNESSSGSRTRSSIRSSSEETQHLHETVVERVPGSKQPADSGEPLLPGDSYQQRQPHPHPHPQPQPQPQPQICVTPSSSLAPSSIETAETMQAVDSIQSGTPNMTAHGSIDQYTSGDDYGGQDNIEQQQQQQQQQLATVMRMVKSSSANFDHGAGGRSRAQCSATNQFGTLNLARQPRQNYPTLRARSRQLNQLNEEADTTFRQAFTANQTAAHHMDDVAHLYQANQATDPSTISLLSLSRALSSSTSANSFAMPDLADEALRTTVAAEGRARDFRRNLCHYHSRMLVGQQQQPAPAPLFVGPGELGSALASGAQPAPGVILEQEEEQQAFNLDPALGLPPPPPPPPPRVMEALSFYDNNPLCPNEQDNY